jgi:paired small multidrug resistance pump
MPLYLHAAWYPEWAIAALVGAFLSIPLQHDANTLCRRAWHVLLSTAVGFYLAPLLGVYYTLGATSIVAVAFLLGLFGTAITVAILQAVRTADVWALLKSRSGDESK